jgi:hypothetical protein
MTKFVVFRRSKSESKAADRSVCSTQASSAFLPSTIFVISMLRPDVAVVIGSPGNGLSEDWSADLLAANCGPSPFGCAQGRDDKLRVGGCGIPLLPETQGAGTRLLGGRKQVLHFAQDDKLFSIPAVKIRVKGSGQECPLYTNPGAFFPPTGRVQDDGHFSFHEKVLVASCCGCASSGLFCFVFHLVF